MTPGPVRPGAAWEALPVDLPVLPPVKPMLAKATHALPEDPEGRFAFEPKWDGFRCIVFRDGDEVELGSRNDRPLTRYVPELLGPLRAALPQRCVVDGELVIVRDGGLDFDALQARIHPAASRIALLAEETPASYVAFDLLALGDRDLTDEPLRERRRLLESVLGAARPPVHLTPQTTDRAEAADWFGRFEGAGLDGVMAKDLDGTYEPGRRTQVKVKHERTADCVVGGYRLHKDGQGVGSLVLGLYDDGALHHVGVASSFKADARAELLAQLGPLADEARGADHPWASGDEHAPGGGVPSRWQGDRDLSFVPLPPELVVEVAYDHLQGHRFRHTTRLRRWRPDRDPRSCTFDQLEVVPPAELAELFPHGR